MSNGFALSNPIPYIHTSATMVCFPFHAGVCAKKKGGFFYFRERGWRVGIGGDGLVFHPTMALYFLSSEL